MRCYFAVLLLLAGSLPPVTLRLGRMVAHLGAPVPIQVRTPVRPPDPDSLFHLLHEASSGLRDPVRTVVRDSATWEAWWKRVTANHRQAVPVPPV